MGGSAATFYAPSAYQSFDADFVAQFGVTRKRELKLIAVMNGLGYTLDGERTFRNRNGNPFAVEFPKGPLGIGGDSVGYTTFNRGEKLLNVITATDSVKDRLSCYYYWDDRTALRAAVDASLSADDYNADLVKTWSVREGQLGKYADFERLRAARMQRV